MKMKHNKKRNTAFLYESLIKELTKSIINKDHNMKSKIVEIVKKYFNKQTILHKELKLYEYLAESNEMEETDAQRYMFEVKKDYHFLDKKEVFNAQTQLLKEINSTLGADVFSNFVPNYKTLASIGQFFNSHSLKPKSRILVEKRVLEGLVSKSKSPEEMQHIDKLTYKTFVNKFNDSYSNSLQTEQKDLLINYITSFSDNGLQLKAFLNEELGRLKSIIKEQKETDHRLEKVLSKLNDFSKKPINKKMIEEVFFVQNLVMEITKNGN